MADPQPTAPIATLPIKPVRPLRRRLLFIGLPVVVAGVALTAYLLTGRYVSTDDAYVKANVLTVSTDVAGTIIAVTIHENDSVAAGQPLYRLEDSAYRLALAGAQAHLSEARNDIMVMRSTYAQKCAEAQQAQTDATYYAKEFDRIAPLVKSNAATPAQVDAAQRNLSSAQQRVNGLRAQAQATLAGLGGQADAPVDEHPRVLNAIAQVALAQRDLAHARVCAPSAGIISHSDNLRPGLYLSSAAPALAIIESGHMWIEASFKETDLAHVHPGQDATISVDAYPDRTWKGSVETISPATGAQFALLPAQNASGNWVKVVQRIPVRIRMVTAGDGPQLSTGMSATVRIDTRHSRSLGELARNIGRWLGFGA